MGVVYRRRDGDAAGAPTVHEAQTAQTRKKTKKRERTHKHKRQRERETRRSHKGVRQLISHDSKKKKKQVSKIIPITGMDRFESPTKHITAKVTYYIRSTSQMQTFAAFFRYLMNRYDHLKQTSPPPPLGINTRVEIARSRIGATPCHGITSQENKWLLTDAKIRTSQKSTQRLHYQHYLFRPHCV